MFTGTSSLFRVKWAGWSPSWLVPVNATDDNKSKVITPSGFGYSIGLDSAAGISLSWSGSEKSSVLVHPLIQPFILRRYLLPSLKVHGSAPLVSKLIPEYTIPPNKPRLEWKDGLTFRTCFNSFQIQLERIASSYSTGSIPKNILQWDDPQTPFLVNSMIYQQ